MNSTLFSLGEIGKNTIVAAISLLVVMLVKGLLGTENMRKTAPVPVSNEQPDRKECYIERMIDD
jgi:hypothetical protein